MLKYPPEFVQKVIEEYDERPEFAELAVKNDYGLGRLLADGSSYEISPEEIVSAFESGDPDSVLVRARSCVRRRQLHAEWMRIVVREISCVTDRVSALPSSPASSRRRYSRRPYSLYSSPPEAAAPSISADDV